MSEPEPFIFEDREHVIKVAGDYNYPGVIVARFHTLKGKARYVVEATGTGYRGMLHIFNTDQLGRNRLR